MLVLTDCVEINERPAIEYDQFVPVTITWPRYHRLLEPLRIVDIQGSNGYIEFKADTITGELVRSRRSISGGDCNVATVWRSL